MIFDEEGDGEGSVLEPTEGASISGNCDAATAP